LLGQTIPADFASYEEATGSEQVNTTSGADAVQETGLTARERKIESYTNLLARAQSAEQISQLIMWDDNFFAQAVDDVRRNGFDSEYAALSGFEMGREDDPNRLADALASQREQFAAAILDRADFAGAIATRGLNGVGVDGFEGMSHPEAANLSSDTIDYFGDPASFEGVTRESFQAMYAAGLMDYKTHEVVFSTAETRRLDKASLIAGGLTFGVSIALNPRAAINAVKGFGRASLSALNLSAKQLGRLKDVFAGNFAAITRRTSNKFGRVEAPKSNPLADPKVAKQIRKDSSAIYGYSPKPGKGLDKFGIDFSDAGQVASARAKRIEYLQDLEKKKAALTEEVSMLQHEGMSLEDIARLKVDSRNQSRIDSYLQSNNLDGLKSMQERNLIEYGRKQGPTADQLFEIKGSWEDVIFGSVKSSRAMDVLLGLD
jgi:hypothetical protein